LDDKNLYINGELMDKRVYDKYKQFHNLLTPKVLGNPKFGLTISKNDTISNPTALAPFPKMLPGHCYALCRLENGGYEEAWREVLCQNLVTPEVIKLVITKLKADGSLAATESATEFTKEAQNALTAYQKKHKLPQGNLNLETVQHMSIRVK
jgi:hypothetical protein